MTSVADPASFSSISLHSTRTPESSRVVSRAIRYGVCATLAIATFWLWLAPDAPWMQNALLFRICASALAAAVAVACLLGALRPAPARIEVDTIMHEVRLVKTRGRDRFVLDRCAFRDLTAVKNVGSHLQLWGPNSTLVAEVAAADRVSHCSLVTALRVAGKL